MTYEAECALKSNYLLTVNFYLENIKSIVNLILLSMLLFTASRKKPNLFGAKNVQKTGTVGRFKVLSSNVRTRTC